jgi:hypothetical protein
MKRACAKTVPQHWLRIQVVFFMILSELHFRNTTQSKYFKLRSYATIVYKGISKKSKNQFENGLKGIVFSSPKPIPENDDSTLTLFETNHNDSIDKINSAVDHNWGRYL